MGQQSKVTRIRMLGLLKCSLQGRWQIRSIDFITVPSYESSLLINKHQNTALNRYLLLSTMYRTQEYSAALLWFKDGVADPLPSASL